MLARLSLITLCAVLAAAPAMAKDKAPTGALACSGAFGIDSSEALLIETYGADNVLTGEVDGPEGSTMIATRVFPDQPDKEMTFAWWDEENYTNLANVALPPTAVSPGGVKVGMTVAEVEAINGGPFEISGFGWDYGGFANLEGGPLAKLPGDCVLSVRFALPDEYSDAIDVSSILGDGTTVPSDEGLLEVLDVRVSAVSFGYAHPDYR